jgi:homoserine kinase
MTALGESPDADRVFKIAGEFEHHLDNVAPALLGGLVGVAYRDDGVPHAFPLPLSERVGFAFAAPGVEIETQRARDALPARVTLADAVHNIGAVVALTQALATGDPALVRLGLSDRLHVRYRVPLIPAADLAIAAAVERGAWGATVSGAGSGIIAFSEPARAAAVADAMAAVFRAEVGVHGVVAFAADAETRGTVAG